MFLIRSINFSIVNGLLTNSSKPLWAHFTMSRSDKNNIIHRLRHLHGIIHTYRTAGDMKIILESKGIGSEAFRLSNQSHSWIWSRHVCTFLDLPPPPKSLMVKLQHEPPKFATSLPLNIIGCFNLFKVCTNEIYSSVNQWSHTNVEWCRWRFTADISSQCKNRHALSRRFLQFFPLSKKLHLYSKRRYS